MQDILDVAKYICSKVKEIDEMKLQKLLYFIQRENISIFGLPMFYGKFKAWKYGPISIKVRKAYRNKELKNSDKEISVMDRYIVDNILNQYLDKRSWELSLLTHNQKSWQDARKGLNEYDKGYKYIDIYKDVENYRPYDSFWDMYFDEFEDYYGG